MPFFFDHGPPPRSGPIEMVMLLLGAGANTSTLTPEGIVGFGLYL